MKIAENLALRMYPEKKEIYSDGKAPIYVKVTVTGSKAKQFSTDIYSIYDHHFTGRLEYVRDCALFAIFTGYAFCELDRFQKSDIFVGDDGSRWIKIDRKKTGKPELMPLLPIPASIVDKYWNDPYCIANNKLLPLRSYQHFNGYLKELAGPTISEFHRLRELPAPVHPLISLIDYRLLTVSPWIHTVSWVYDFYLISLKTNIDGKIKYGQQQYDFDEGTMFFMAPGQVFKILRTRDNPERAGWMLLVHPDFLWSTPLGKKIRTYSYFGYSTREALFLSAQEEIIVSDIVHGIQREYQASIDQFSQPIILSQLEVLLDEHFSDHRAKKGLPAVKVLAEQLDISPDYLSSLLKVTTGLGTQQHIHGKLIEKAKEKLSGTTLSVSEIAYDLSFEHPQSFSKLFKAKTNLSPLEFRSAFN